MRKKTSVFERAAENMMVIYDFNSFSRAFRAAKGAVCQRFGYINGKPKMPAGNG
jgi:hypothetical protein